MRYFIGFYCHFHYVLVIFFWYTVQGFSQLMLCPDSQLNQTVRSSVGSAARFMACLISNSSYQGLYGGYRVRYGFQKNESLRLLFWERNDQKYNVELIISDVQLEHFGTHVVSVMSIVTQQDILNFNLTLLEEENAIIEHVLPVCVTIGATLILIASAFIVKKAGNRCQQYTINKKMYSMKKFFKLQKRKQSHVTIPVENINDDHYDTVNEVTSGPDDNENGTEIIYEGIVTREAPCPKETPLSMRYTTMSTNGSPSEDRNTSLLGLDSDYITPIDVVKRSRRCKKKSKSLQRDAPNHTDKKERHRLKPYRSMDYSSNAGTDKDENYHHYCNCELFKKTQEPTLLSIKQLRSSNTDPLLDGYVVVDGVAEGRSAVGTLEADSKAGKSTEYKCHKYVNLEQFWDSFKSVNQELKHKTIAKQSYGRKCHF